MPMIEQYPAAIADIDDALVDFDQNKDPILIPQPLPPGHEMETFVATCEWLYLAVHHKKRMGLLEVPGAHEEFVLMWMYESLSILSKIHGVWENFYLLREISYGINDNFEYRPTVKLGMIKEEDILWLQYMNRPSPESKRFFAKEICYDRPRTEFTQPFGPGVGQNVKFWIYSTQYPFWNHIPQFFSEKHNRYHNIRIFEPDVILKRAWELICDYECLWTSTQQKIANVFLQKLGLQDISSWTPTALFLPQLGAQWKTTCAKHYLRIPGHNLRCFYKIHFLACLLHTYFIITIDIIFFLHTYYNNVKFVPLYLNFRPLSLPDDF